VDDPTLERTIATPAAPAAQLRCETTSPGIAGNATGQAGTGGIDTIQTMGRLGYHHQSGSFAIAIPNGGTLYDQHPRLHSTPRRLRIRCSSGGQVVCRLKTWHFTRG